MDGKEGRAFIGLGILPVLMAAAVPANAEQALGPPPTEAGEGQIEAAPSVDASDQMTGDIIVVAQKRRESAQKVPISIQAMTSNELQQMGIKNTNDLPLAVPGFQISSSANNQLYYLRGVGSQQVSTGISSEVATFVDGVYMPFQGTNLQGFNNIVSIEVDKGPQGTLFGRNATGGAIQITTKDPQFDFGGEASAGYGSYNHAVGSLYLTGPLSDTIAADIALLADDQMDGYGKNLATGKDVWKRKILTARTKWLINISDATQLRLSADVTKATGDAGTLLRRAKGVQLWNLVTNTQQNIPGFYNVDLDSKANHSSKNYGGSAKLTSDFGWAQFMSITAYRTFKAHINVDYDGSPIYFLPVFVENRENMFSQELQLSSPSGNWLTWTVGLYFLKQRGHTEPLQFGEPFSAAVFQLPPGDTYNVYSNTALTSYAGYAQATAKILPATNLTLGVRYTHDETSIDGFAQITGPVAPAPFVIPSTVGSQKATFAKPTFRITLDHDFSPTTKAFVSFNRGFQSANFNGGNSAGFSRAVNPPLEPETIDAYEIGLKSEPFDRRLRFNISAFLYNYRNLQQQTYINGGLQTLNAGAARIKGIDLEIRYQPSSNLTIGMVGEALEAKFTDYVNAPGYTYPLGFGLGPLVPTPIPNAKGNYLLFAPKWTATGYINHTLKTSVGKFLTSATVSYNDGFFADPGNLYKEPSFTVVNLTEEWAPNDNFSLSLWVRNLFDKKYDQSVTAVGTIGFVGNTVGAPRELGFTTRYKF